MPPKEEVCPREDFMFCKDFKKLALLLLFLFCALPLLFSQTTKVDTDSKPKLELGLPLGHNGEVYSVAYSPDGRFLASGSWDGTVKIWGVTTGACLKTLKGHSSFVRSVSFSPDGRHIISGSKDTSVKIWDAASGNCLATLHTFGEDDWSVTTPEGLFDASDGAMEKMYFVQGLEMIELGQLKDRYYEPGLLAKVMGYNEEGITIDPGKLPERVKLYPEIEALVMMDTLEVKLIPRDGGIGKVRVAINGKEIADDVLGANGARGTVRTEDGKAVYFTVPLKNHPNLIPGKENEISVYAYESENWLKSRPVSCTYRTEAVDTTIIPNVYIIAAGISDYTGNIIDLNFAAKDAEDIAFALSLGARRLFGTDKTEVSLLTAGKEESGYGFQNREPTKENLRRAIEEAAEKAKSTDIVIIYLSGHGISYGSDPGDFYYLTKEAKSARSSSYSDPVIRRNASLSSTELMELVKQVPANRQVLIIDTCASGRVVDNLMAEKSISSSTVRALDRMKDRTGMFILTGSAADAVSYEASSFGQGILTYSLLEGIKGAALRDNSYIDVMTLFTRAQERVPQLAEHLGGIQRPEVFAQNRLGSFDIGMVTPEEQEKVPLAQPRPVFIQSNFQDEYLPRDLIDLGKYVDEELKRRSEQGRNSDCVFVPVREYPHAYSVGGRYERKGDSITLKAGLFEGDNPVETFTITAKNAKTLAYQLVERALGTAND